MMRCVYYVRIALAVGPCTDHEDEGVVPIRLVGGVARSGMECFFYFFLEDE